MRRFIHFTSPVIFAFLLLGCPDPAPPPAVDNDEARQQMEAAADAYAEVWNTGDLAPLDTLVAADFRRNFADTVITGRDALANNIRQNRNAFSDLSVRLEETIYDGNLGVARFILSGTNDGPFMGMPATNQRMEIMGMSMLRFSNGQLQEEWVAADQSHMLRQLGLMPPAPPAPDEEPLPETPEEEPPGDEPPGEVGE